MWVDYEKNEGNKLPHFLIASHDNSRRVITAVMIMDQKSGYYSGYVLFRI